MARFHDLEVTDIHKTIRDAVVVTLKPVNGAAEEFDFTQGQYLTFRQDFDGEELRRSYSICAGKDEGILQVGVKRVDGGASREGTGGSVGHGTPHRLRGVRRRRSSGSTPWPAGRPHPCR